MATLQEATTMIGYVQRYPALPCPVDSRDIATEYRAHVHGLPIAEMDALLAIRDDLPFTIVHVPECHGEYWRLTLKCDAAAITIYSEHQEPGVYEPALLGRASAREQS